MPRFPEEVPPDSEIFLGESVLNPEMNEARRRRFTWFEGDLVRVDKKPFTGDPFAGKCIHGLIGARFVDGKLSNPHCDECQKQT